MNKLKLILVNLFVALMISAGYSQSNIKKYWPEQDWALGFAWRTASIPFATEGEKVVGTLIPMLFYEGKIFYMRGIEAGFKLYHPDRWQINAISRMHFFDFPREYQNLLQGDNLDWGIQVRYDFTKPYYTEVEFLTDLAWHNSSNIRLGREDYLGRFRLDSFFQLKLKSKSYNSYYFGLTLEEVDAGVDMSLGMIADFHVSSNFYFYGGAMATLLDKNVRNVSFVNSDFTGQVLFGLGISNDPTVPRKDELRATPYIRFGHGWATPTALVKIVQFQAVKDTNNSQLTSIFYGHPLTDELFGAQIDVYLTPGFTWHWANHVQQSAQEFIIAIKLYYTIKWPIRWRIGGAEGMSYVNRIPFMERTSLEGKDYVPSNLMNFLDFSIDFNIGDIFGGEQLKKWWFGYYIHHRSSIFESAQHFGRISGGSNYQTLYLQWHY